VLLFWEQVATVDLAQLQWLPNLSQLPEDQLLLVVVAVQKVVLLGEQVATADLAQLQWLPYSSVLPEGDQLLLVVLAVQVQFDGQ